MAALCARLATAGRASLARGGFAAPLATPARAAPAPARCRRRDVATAAVTTADFEALSNADGAGDGSGGFAAAALRLAAGVLAGVPASVALDEVADREGQRVRALTNAQTAEGVRMHVSFPASVHAGEPAPVVILIHQARRVRQRRARRTAPPHAAALHGGGRAR
jgi:enterochelin esterase-like enzyme